MISTGTPWPLRLAVWLLLGEALAAAVVAIILLYQDLTAEATALVSALAVTGFAAIMAAVLAGLGVALSHRRSRARAPAMVLQLLAMAMGWVLITAGQVWIGLPIMLVAMLLVVLLLMPATNAALAEPATSTRDT